MGYHYGQTIREHRMLRNMSLSQLAEKWPSKDTGVTPRYVSDIERGVKHISDIQVLRELSNILNIPLWKLGLSEYNPFQDSTDIKVFFDSDSLEQLIEDCWLLRLNMPMYVVEEKVKKLSMIFQKLIEKNSLLKSNKDFLRLRAHEKRLQEVLYTEKHNYTMALKLAGEMLQLATLSGDTVARAIAMVRVGVELLRDENRQALEYLKAAKDLTFEVRSKELAAYVYAMLARGYATFHMEQDFYKAINTSINFASNMVGLPVTTKNHIYHAYSAIIEERVNGFILFGNGRKAVEDLVETDKQATRETNTYLKMWLPLDYAQGYMLQGEIEESVKYLETFYNSIKGYDSERIKGKVQGHLDHLDVLGYADLPVVQGFKQMYFETGK